MFGKSYKLFTLLGFEVRLDLSWLVIAGLVVWSLASGFFPVILPGRSAGSYWLMGLGGAVGIFFSIVFHELSHSLVARRFGLPISGITLFIFGGVAEMNEEPPSPRAEYLMAAAGPLFSLLAALLCYLLHVGAALLGWPQPLIAVLFYLALLNLILAVFNLIPAFPLDGGRVLRALLWRWKRDIHWATQVSGRIGVGFGLLLMFLGAYAILLGNYIGGLWWLLIGMFLREAAGMSYKQLLLRDALQGRRVRDLMSTLPVAVMPQTSVQDLMDQYFYKYQFKLFPVSEDGRLLGAVSLDDVRGVAREHWASTPVGQIMRPVAPDNAIAPEAGALDALRAMQHAEVGRLMVVERGVLVGMLSMKDFMTVLSRAGRRA